MLDEPVVFIAPDDGPAEAGLLFVPRELHTVRNLAGTITYTEGADYLVDRGQGRLVRTPGSRMPLVWPDGLVAHDDVRMHERLVAVSYTHDLEPVPQALAAGAGSTLERTAGRLRRQEPLSICLLGDSIAEGYDASGFHGVPPLQPGFASLVASALGQLHGGPVRLDNLAVAGSSAADGRWLTADAAAKAPHLVIVAYGMNDACWADADEFAINMTAILDGIRAKCPEVECLLVSPMLPTPHCHWVMPERFPHYRDALLHLGRREGVAVADVTALWRAVLERKSPYDLTANGTNHPNDFGHRLYVQTLLALVSSPRVEGIEPAARP